MEARECKSDGCDNLEIIRFRADRNHYERQGLCGSCNNLRNYGMTMQDKKDLYARQNGCCAICDVNIPFGGRGGGAIDHCHTTGVVRGMLCKECNTGLGKLGDTVEALERALDYLRGASNA